MRWLVIVFGPVLTPLLCRTQAVWWMSRFECSGVFVADFVFYCDLGRSSFMLNAFGVVVVVVFPLVLHRIGCFWCYFRCWVCFFFALCLFLCFQRCWLLIAFKYCRTQSSCCLLSILCVLALLRCAQPRNLCVLHVCFGVVVLSVGRWCTRELAITASMWRDFFFIFVNTFCVTICTTKREFQKGKTMKKQWDQNAQQPLYRSDLDCELSATTSSIYCTDSRSHLVTLHKST